ncbi:hypothetical protein J1605_001612 [Eschrichtius robustus]|uniref:Fibronectin type-III domain-containing protein n=1 Tax=Eschrichtius robustus TaxID=9764 RepID=A0AB34I2G8_ESCRO|nr:hypothetical protein J1605_001612 [Eschrichtius robustus]
MESAMAVDLNPWVEYEFRVVATNPIGTGDPSTPSRKIRTNEAAILIHKWIMILSQHVAIFFGSYSIDKTKGAEKKKCQMKDFA